MKSSIVLNSILLVFAVLGIMSILLRYKESFLSPGMYPSSDEQGILAGEYQMQPNPGLSSYNSTTAWELYPSYAVGSYAQITNNKKYWESPCNGLSTPPDMCGGIYQQKTVTAPTQSPPESDCRRVNYYCYD